MADDQILQNPVLKFIGRQGVLVGLIFHEFGGGRLGKDGVRA